MTMTTTVTTTKKLAQAEHSRGRPLEWPLHAEPSGGTRDGRMDAVQTGGRGLERGGGTRVEWWHEAPLYQSLSPGSALPACSQAKVRQAVRSNVKRLHVREILEGREGGQWVHWRFNDAQQGVRTCVKLGHVSFRRHLRLLRPSKPGISAAHQEGCQEMCPRRVTWREVRQAIGGGNREQRRRGEEVLREKFGHSRRRPSFHRRDS